MRLLKELVSRIEGLENADEVLCREILVLWDAMAELQEAVLKKKVKRRKEIEGLPVKDKTSAIDGCRGKTGRPKSGPMNRDFFKLREES